MAKGNMMQIRLTPEQKNLLLKAAGESTLTDYVLGRLFKTVLNDDPPEIALNSHVKSEKKTKVPKQTIEALQEQSDDIKSELSKPRNYTGVKFDQCGSIWYEYLDGSGRKMQTKDAP